MIFISALDLGKNELLSCLGAIRETTSDGSVKINWGIQHVQQVFESGVLEGATSASGDAEQVFALQKQLDEFRADWKREIGTRGTGGGSVPTAASAWAAPCTANERSDGHGGRSTERWHPQMCELQAPGARRLCSADCSHSMAQRQLC